MRYLSTRGNQPLLPFKSVVRNGLARDGGLYLPLTIPRVEHLLSYWQTLSYQELALAVMSLFIDDISEKDLRQIIDKSYANFDNPEITPIRQLGSLQIVELFHGPTLAFKDVALQFLGHLFEYILLESNEQMNVVAATSGDTGSAAIHGLRGRDNIRIFVMHPYARVSPVQELQMTTVLDDNVFNLAVEGTFDDCQRIVKELFNDLDFRDKYQLGAVNSINWARVLAQIVYYFYATLRVMKEHNAASVSFAVPTGNFGDIFAGYLAWRMGLPIAKLVLATNENDILSRYFNTGIYQTGDVHTTISPSMDIQIASNFERYLYYLAGESSARVVTWMQELQVQGSLTPGVADHQCFQALRCDTSAVLECIRSFWHDHQYLLDPHTAVGVVAAQHFAQKDTPMLALATAHPAKFGEAIFTALGSDLAQHPAVTRLHSLPVRVNRITATAEAVAGFIKNAVAQDLPYRS